MPTDGFMGRDHILFIIFDFLFICLVLYAAHFVKKAKGRNFILLAMALICFFLHMSCCYVSFFNSEGSAGQIVDNQLFPIFFCNYSMFLLLFTALWQDKSTRLFKNLATYTAWSGIFGGLITIFAKPPVFAVWGAFQSALSHSFLLLGCLYIFVGGYATVNVFNLVPFCFGLLSAGAVGAAVEIIFRLGGKPSPNAMYFFAGPSEAPMFNGWVLAACFILIIFVFTSLFELLSRKDRNDRWYRTNADLAVYLPVKIKRK